MAAFLYFSPLSLFSFPSFFFTPIHFLLQQVHVATGETLATLPTPQGSFALAFHPKELALVYSPDDKSGRKYVVWGKGAWKARSRLCLDLACVQRCAAPRVVPTPPFALPFCRREGVVELLSAAN